MIISAVRSLANQTTVQRVASKAGAIIPDKLAKTFEMTQTGTISRIPLVMLSLVFVLGARFVKSRDNHERREVLTRDAATIFASMLGVPVVKNLMSRGLEKLSKIPIADDKSKLFFLGDFGLDNVKNWYSKANYMPQKALTMAQNIKERGGDVATAFSKLGKYSKNCLNTLLNGKTYNSENILAALESASKLTDGSEAQKAFSGLSRVLSNPKNGLVSAAQRLKAIPALASIAFITAVLGVGIPAFNIYFTRNKLKNNNNTDNTDSLKLSSVSLAGNLEPKISNEQKQIISSFFSK